MCCAGGTVYGGVTWRGDKLAVCCADETVQGLGSGPYVVQVGLSKALSTGGHLAC